MIGLGVDDGSGYLLLGGNLSTRIAPHWEAPVAISQHQNLKGLGKLGGDSGGLFTALGRGGGEASLPPSNLLHLFFFFKDSRIHSFPQHHEH